MGSRYPLLQHTPKYKCITIRLLGAECFLRSKKSLHNVRNIKPCVISHFSLQCAQKPTAIPNPRSHESKYPGAYGLKLDYNATLPLTTRYPNCCLPFMFFFPTYTKVCKLLSSIYVFLSKLKHAYHLLPTRSLEFDIFTLYCGFKNYRKFDTVFTMSVL